MIVRTAYPAGVPCWLELGAPDPAAAADFMAGLFGWEIEPGPDRMLARLDGHPIAAVGTGEPGWCTSIAVPDAVEAVERARVSGARVLDEVATVGVGGTADAARTARLVDPDGAAFGVWEAREIGGSALVNYPGTWNFSDLHAADPERAAAFYGTVFGWVADRVDIGGFSATMWRVPGYGDVLAELDPALRERHADPGVPPGFSDAVAWLHQADGAHRWETTFAVTDTDAVARRAVELGGTVATPPYSEGPSRVAVLRDPQGATFVVNAYAP